MQTSAPAVRSSIPRTLPWLLFVALLGLSACGHSGQLTAGATPRGRQNCTPVASADGTKLVTPGTLTMGADVSYPPQEFYDSRTHEPAGFDVDLGNALANQLCLNFAVWNESFNTIIPDLQKANGHYDVIISAMTITPERSQQLAFIPYLKAGEQLVVRKDAARKPAQLSQLCGLRVAVESGTAEMDELNNTVEPLCTTNPMSLSGFSTDAEALEQLNKGSADVEFTDSPVAQYDVEQNSGLQVSSGVLDVAPEGIAMRPADTALIKAMNAAFAVLKSDGVYAQLLAKWGLQASSCC